MRRLLSGRVKAGQSGMAPWGSNAIRENAEIRKSRLRSRAASPPLPDAHRIRPRRPPSRPGGSARDRRARRAPRRSAPAGPARPSGFSAVKITTSSARPARDEARRDARAALAEDAGDAARRKRLAARRRDRHGRSSSSPTRSTTTPQIGEPRLALRRARSAPATTSVGRSRAPVASREPSGRPRRVSSTTRQRLAVEARQAHRQRRIVGERGLDADHDRLVRRAHHLHARVGDLAGDPQARRRAAPPEAKPSAVSASFSVTQGRPSRTRADMAEMIAPRLIGARARPTTAIPAARSRACPCPATARIGILDRRRPRARRRPRSRRRRRAASAEMRAGLERHVERRAARRLARLGERDRSACGRPPGAVDAPADDDAVLDEDRADATGWARRGRATARRN